MSVVQNEAETAISVFIEQIADISIHFFTKSIRKNIVERLNSSFIVRSFCSTDRAKVMSHTFFAIYEYTDNGEVKVGVVDTVVLLPATTTACISLSRPVSIESSTQSMQSAQLPPLPQISLADVSLQSVSLQHPLAELNNALVSLYEPLCRGSTNIMTSQITELIGSIRSHVSLMIDFKVSRYVHPDLLKLCEQNPQLTPKQIVDEMGPKANDNAFLNSVQALRSKCVNIFDVDIHAHEVETIREEVAYWQHLDTWMDDIKSQLQSREWQLVQRVLQKRGADASVEKIFTDKKSLVSEYYRFLTNIPYLQISMSDMEQLPATVRSVFEQLSRSQKFPPLRLMKVADAVVNEICSRIIKLAKGTSILGMKPNDAMKFLGSIRNVLSETQNGYTQTKDLRVGGVRRDIQPAVKRMSDRVQLLQDFINNHFYLYDALKSIFVTEHQDFVTTLQHRYEELQAKEDVLWKLDDNEFNEGIASYNAELSKLDDAISLLVRSKLDNAASSEEMFQVHETFQKIRREKVKMVLSNKHEELIQLIGQSIDSVKERYFDEVAGQRAVRVAVANGNTPLVGTIKWHKSVEQALNEQLKKRDAVSEFGWHQLLSLQTIDFQWILNNQLASFLGVNMTELARDPRIESAPAEIFGTAFALAFLDLLYSDERADWERSIGVVTARQQLEKKDSQAFTVALNFFRQNGVGARQIANRDKAREFRLFKDKISSGIRDHVIKWCNHVRSVMSQCTIDVQSRTLNGKVFMIRKNRIEVDFPAEMPALVTDLKVLVSHDLITSSVDRFDDVRMFLDNNESKLSIAVTISQLLDMFYQKNELDQDGHIAELLSEEYDSIYKMVLDGAKLRWNAFTLTESFAEKLATAMNDFCNLMDDIRTITSAIEEVLIVMEHDICDPTKIINHIAEIKKLVNDLAIKSPNSRLYLARLQPRVDDILLMHMQNIIFTWLEEFTSMANDTIYMERQDATTQTFKLSPLRLTMRVTKDDVQLDSLPMAWRAHWYGRFNEAIDWINAIPYFETYGTLSGTATKSYYNSYARLVDKLPEGLIRKVYSTIEYVIMNTLSCEERWRVNQQFYNLNINASSAMLGDDLQKWNNALNEIRRDAAEQMNSTKPLLLLGGIVIDAREAQDRLASRFDGMQQALAKKFRDVVSVHFTTSYNTLRTNRESVECFNVSDSIDEAIQFLSEVHAIQERIDEIKDVLPQFQMAEKTLRGTGTFQLTTNWISVERVVGEYSTLCEAIERRKEIINKRRSKMEQTVYQRAKAIDERIQILEKEYRQASVVDGNVPPSEALDQITCFYNIATDAENVLREVQRAQYALGQEPMQSSKLESILSDLRGQKQAYSSVKELYDEIDKLKSMRFTEVQPRNLQQALYTLQERMSNFNPAVRHFAAYTTLDVYIKELLSNHRFIQDLRSDAILDRHWIALKTQLKRTKWIVNDLTLGDVWDSKPVVNSKIYLAVLETAHGQHRLQMQIDHIAEFWNNHPLEVTFFQNRVTLIKGWDVLFEKLGEDLNSLTAMKLSPHFTDTIAATANDWDEKLNRARQVLEMLVDVQRRWVYLDGIFSGSIEIRHQLPAEASQFDKTSKEFIALMPKAKGDTITVLKLIAVEKILLTLEKIARELSMIQKTLGEYLETQRSQFPRFYFVGDEDLLEVIGNGKDPLLVAKHLKKMFCGISSLTMEPTKDKSGLLKAMISPETEEVSFSKFFDTAGMAVYEWLSQLEQTMMVTLRKNVGLCLADVPKPGQSFEKWIAQSPAQIIALTIQIHWVQLMEAALSANKDTISVEKTMSTMLKQLAANVLTPDLKSISRHKSEQVITVAVYQRDNSRRLAAKGVKDIKHYDWLSTMRHYYVAGDADGHVVCKMADASFDYSFEYLGLTERLVQTSLTDKTFLTLTQALHTRLGGSPAGPAGTGKTETVKALGMQLGRFVLVFNCDETFDFKSMGRIFVGLCQVGAWGCFDEFNRLEERILSAVSQQIQTIQEGLKGKATEIVLADRRVSLHNNLGIFITMNPGYAGRSNLPDNLKQLFRPVAMTSPDRENIAEVMLFAQGFKTAETLSRKIVPLFRLCRDQLSQQLHYDFGLRALKSVLVSAGGLKRTAASRGDGNLSGEDEIRLMMQSLTETIVPKLIAEDVDLFYPLLRDVFPGFTSKEIPLNDLRNAINEVATASGYTPSEIWVAKLLQLYKLLSVNHGIMLVGSSGCGKTSAWMTLLRALAKIEDVDGHAYIIDPKALTKGELYGVLDQTTREWKDGVFTATLRKIVDNVKGDDQSKKRHWIFFDGDVDPEWVENLNSLLDDNKLLTLPNGERLTLPPNVRIMFEVQDLRYATPATVSRCGMVWFSHETISSRHLIDHHIYDYRTRPYYGKEELPLSFAERASFVSARKEKMREDGNDDINDFTTGDTGLIAIQKKVADAAEEYFRPNGFVEQTLALMEKEYSQYGIMEYNRAQSIRSFFTLFAHSAGMIRDYQEQHDREIPLEKVRIFVRRRIIQSLLWGFASQYPTMRREEFAVDLKSDVPRGSLLEYEVRVEDGEWTELRNRVLRTEIAAQKVGTNDVVIPTVDTTRHEDVLSAWIRSGKPVILCGPPGSGKTMSLTAVLRASTEFEAAFLNFSCGTLPDTITKIFDQYCTVKNTLNGLIMTPTSGKKLIIFCDEINLPNADKYCTQRVIQFMRQLTERRGFYRAKDNAWVTVDRVQFVGACNPPTDPGRVPLTHRLLRWAPVLFVDFPTYESLLSIYETYCRALLQKNLKLRPVSLNLAKAMVDVYKKSQEHFTPEVQRHYVYSPRELSRWSRAIYEGIQSLDDGQQKNLSPEELVRLAVHEGLRLFRDRLTTEEEGEWTDRTIDECFTDNFPGLSSVTLERPILFSTVLTRAYTSSSREQLRTHIREKLKAFADEELDVELVVFDAVVDHVVRIDRVLRQPLGHMLLVGSSGVGKTVLSRFVAWMNNLSVFQVKAHHGYTIVDFEEDLRGVMRRSGCKREKICFIFDESNIMDSSFLEYMNALLASGEVPGLFDGEEWSKLIHEIRDGVNAAGSSSFVDLSSEPDMYKWFVSNVQMHLHVVFTMNPHSPDFHNRSATSPALFNRCTIDWFGDWSTETIFQVARELTAKVDVMPAFSGRYTDSDIAHDIAARCMCRIHSTVSIVNESVRTQSANRGTFITPRHFLDFIQHFHVLFKEKRGEVEELQRHLNTGLTKLRETSDLVDQQKKALYLKEKNLAKSGRKAQEMLEIIISETEKAKHRKEEATLLKSQLEIESKKINEDRFKIEGELEQAEPALKEAEAALSTIKPEYLREIRAYTTPPPTVKKVLEAVITVLGEKRAVDWEVIKNYIRKEDFISQVKAFKPSSITDDARDRVKKVYLTDETFTYENALRASKAAGPLQKWVVAQVRYSEIFSSVGPMRIEVENLTAAYEIKLCELRTAEQEISDSEMKICKLKDDYQITTTETSQIKQEITVVASRCNRATALIEKLLAEKLRWEEQSANFRTQSASVLGDCLISAGFLAYIGYFDELNRRKNIIPEWHDVIDEAQIDFRRDLSIVEYLSNPEDRLIWAANKLPQDNLCVENAIILSRYNRYPLIIDPSGQAVDFLLNNLKSKKITKTSFVDRGFMKHLEMAVRFGYPILVQDVEFIDPVMNPLLNREVRRTGGRHLIRLGSQDIDISPTFQLYMSTRDSTFQFAPDVCGRATMVNFTVTLSSLQSQCLHTIMLHERPDTDEKRTELMKLQGEYRLRLRMLEKQLLTAISDSEGNILENDTLIKTLETLKSESADVEVKMGQSEIAYREIVEVESKYTPTAAAVSKLYFSLSNLEELSSIYRFSLRFFFDIIQSSLSTLPSNMNPDERIPVIIRNIFTTAHFRVTRSLFQCDHLAFELRLAQLRCTIHDFTGKQLSNSDWDQLLTTVVTGAAHDVESLPPVTPRSYSQAQLTQIASLLSNTNFITVKQSMCQKSNAAQWNNFFSGSNPLSSIPSDAFETYLSPARKAFMTLLLCKATRIDAVTSACEAFLRSFFDTDANGNNIIELYKQKPFFGTLAGFSVGDTLHELGPNIPLLLIAAAGFDATGRVEDLARETGMNLQSVAMGSPEGYEEANTFVAQGMRLGTWVLLKNVHLASQFLSTLEKRIHSEQLEGHIHENFRLFLSSELSVKIPPSLVMASVMMVFEPPPGIKSNMLRTLGAVRESQMPQYPKELPRLYFIAAWLHSVVMERMNYLPLGWSKRYEFSEADFRRFIGTIDSWVQIVRGDRHNVPPNELPWIALRHLVANTIYGGRIDNKFDQLLLESFCSSFLCPEAFNPKFNFVNSTSNPIQCGGITLEDFQKWVKELPEVQSPEWLGLPATATEMVLIQRAEGTIQRFIKIQNLFIEDGEGDNKDEASLPSRGGHLARTESNVQGKSRWAQKLIKTITLWQDVIGKTKFKPAPIAGTTPIALALRREAQVGEKLLSRVMTDLHEIREVCGGTMKPTNHHRTLIDAFSREIIPSTWSLYVCSHSLALRVWLSDLRLRLERLLALISVKEADIGRHHIYLGSLFFPEAFLTATRQTVARHHNLALEQLTMDLTLYSSEDQLPSTHGAEITIVGLTLQSAQLNADNLCILINEERSSKIPSARLTWVLNSENSTVENTVDFPIYLNADRSVALGIVSLPVDPQVPVKMWYQRGSCLTTWDSDEK